MKEIGVQLKNWAKQKVWQIVLFVYALGLGTSLSIGLSRCNASCFSCGSCGLYLGIIPVITAVALRNKIKRGWQSIFQGLSRTLKAPSRKGYD